MVVNMFYIKKKKTEPSSRCAARGTRKRGLLTTKNATDEERAKIVKSKKIRLLAPQTKSRKIEKHKCTVCGVTFTDINDLEWHRDTSHTTKSDPAQRKSSRIQRKNVQNQPTSVVSASEGENESTLPYDVPAKQNKTSKTTSEMFYCADCEYCCKRKYLLTTHIRKAHVDKISPLKNRALLSCAVCLRLFTHKNNLRKHVFNKHCTPQEENQRRSKCKRLYCCDICGQGFYGQRDMLAHRTAIHEAASSMQWGSFLTCLFGVKYCNTCSRYYRCEKFFDTHPCQEKYSEQATKVQAILDSPPSFRCDVCSLCFHWKLMYRSHRNVVHSDAEAQDWDAVEPMDIAFCCKSCCNAFSDAETLEQHKSNCLVNAENKINLFTCTLCNCSYSRKADFKKHMRTKHMDAKDDLSESEFACRKKGSIKCPYCDKEKPTRNGILDHIKKAHNIETDTPFVCVPCNKVFKRKATMDAHNQVYHPKEENPEETNKILKEAEILLNGETAYHCNMCNRNILNSVRFIAHYRLHNVERKFTCDLCGKQTRTQHQLNNHIKIIHLNIRNHECDICSKTFHSKQSCEEHRRIHTGERPFSCEICGKTFVAMNALFTHKKFHNDFYAHPCSMCDKKFKVRRSLINHIRTHTGERPFKCEICSKTFNNSSRFSYHKKVTHSDNRPFTCDQCGSCFKANKFLMRHMKLHNIRTHIQFRRRNNPAYFEAHGSNASQKKNDVNGTEGVTDAEFKPQVDLTPTIFTIQRVYEDVSNIPISESNENSNVASLDEGIIEETKSHFLSEAFGDSSNTIEFTNTSSSSGRNGNKHIMCL